MGYWHPPHLVAGCSNASLPVRLGVFGTLTFQSCRGHFGNLSTHSLCLKRSTQVSLHPILWVGHPHWPLQRWACLKEAKQLMPTVVACLPNSSEPVQSMSPHPRPGASENTFSAEAFRKRITACRWCGVGHKVCNCGSSFTL